ncbi:helix-turn-helix transcriptional regulator [Thauera sp.]|jgi:hypothetical protein|uniref:helix-turn-helix transcriptional regulator n=1 Tax=Thauera sp. TaxID=1905334 RepID=UPI002A362C58|nr:HTH domain-containing protein [Thauera sp.]MDX9885280.1 HTH domain-containing protein [Thauera sp.]
MSQAERIARIHFLLKSTGIVTLAQLKADFEVSRATVMRDIELMRDRLGAPIEYDAELNAYKYAKSAGRTLHYRPERFNVPGMWLDSEEAYALLTVLNVIAKIDPGGWMPYVGPLRRVLKHALCEESFNMKGFHKKIGVELPNLRQGKSGVMAKMMRALVNEFEAILVWQGDDEVLNSASCSLQRFVLTSNGWAAEFVVGEDQARQRVPLIRFSDCTLTNRSARLLPGSSSDIWSDLDALRNIQVRV